MVLLATAPIGPYTTPPAHGPYPFAIVVCSKCGVAVEENADFCVACGQHLSVAPLHAAGARKRVTVVFSDITGLPRLGEHLDPETVRNVLARYADEMRHALEAHGGTVEKFVGDAVMAVFGVPIVHEDDALRAVRAAADMNSSLERLNVELERRWGVTIQVQTGVNTGEVLATEGAREEGYVAGDTVNVAARLEQSAKPGEILLGKETYALVRGAVTADPVEPLSLKGKSTRVPAFRLVAVAAPSTRTARALDSPIVGRGSELAKLGNLFQLVVDEGRPRLVTVLGEPGVGKSRLAGELIRRLQHRAGVFRGRCLSYGEGITYWPLAEVVKDAAKIADEHTSAEAQEKIRALLASESDRGSVASTLAGALGLSDVRSPPEEIFWAVRRLLEVLARDRPLVVLFEDLHWGDPTFLNLVEYLSRALDSPLLLMCLARLDLREMRPALATDEGNRSVMALRPLGRADSDELIRNLLGEAPLPDNVSARIVRAAGGNPLFAGEMLRMLVDEGLLERAPAGWRLVADSSEVQIPLTVEAVLADRLDHLKAGERDTIERASVIGEEFWPGAVASLSPPALRDRVCGHLEALVGKELVVRGGHPFAGEEAFKFSHILVRDVAYGGLLKESRSELHERFADWLEGNVGGRVTEHEAILGYHLDQAYGYREQLGALDDQARILASRAADRLASAGMRAAAAREDAAAVSLLSRARSLLPHGALERLELLPVLGESLEGIAAHARASEEIYAEALAGAVAVGHKAVEGRVRLGRAGAEFVTDPAVGGEQTIAAVQEAIAILEEVGDQQTLAKAWRLIGEARLYQGRAADGQQALERALDYVDLDVSLRTANAIFFAMGMCLVEGPVPLDRALSFAQERLEMARGAGRRSLEADMLHLVGIVETRRGRLDSGRSLLSQSTLISEELGLRYMAQWSKRSLGHLELWAEDHEAAERALRESYQVLDEMELMSSLGESAVPLAEALCGQGRFDEAARFLEKVSDAWSSSDAGTAAPLLMVKAKLELAARRTDHAERLLSQALELVDATDWDCLRADTRLASSDVLSQMSDTGQAVSLLRQALHIAEAKEYAVASRRAARKLEELTVL